MKSLTNKRFFQVSALLLLLAACSKPPAPADTTRSVRTVTVKADTLSAQNVYAGEVRSRYQSKLGFRVNGKIIARLVNVGDTVQAGQALARLDATDLALNQSAIEANVGAAQAQVEVARSDLSRYQKLVAQGYLSQAALDHQSTQLKAAQAQLDAAQAGAKNSRNQTGYTVLTADHAGTVAAFYAEVGQVVAAGQPVVEVAQSGNKEVQVSVPEDQIQHVRAGMPATVTLWAQKDQSYPATVREVSASADPYSRTYPVKIALSNPPESLRLGMTASAALPIEGLPQAIKVPMTALFVEKNQAAVWKVNPQTLTVSAQTVTSQGADGNDVVITQGLQSGDVVVTAGVNLLQAGQKVRLMGNQP